MVLDFIDIGLVVREHTTVGAADLMTGKQNREKKKLWGSSIPFKGTAPVTRSQLLMFISLPK